MLELPPSPAHTSFQAGWLPDRLRGTLGAAADRDIDAHLLVCDTCLVELIAHVLGVRDPLPRPVPA